MRDIKFRGKRIDNGEWVYGSYHYIKGKGELRQNKWGGGSEYSSINFDSHLIFEPRLPDTMGWDIKDSFRHHAVIPESVGQFIDMQDKNKIDIYDGDIGEIKTQNGRIERFVVKWGIHRRDMKSGWTVDIPGFCFLINGFPSFPIFNNYLNGHDLDIISIIGNIHDNPEKLKP